MNLLTVLRTHKVQSINIRNQFLLGFTFENIVETIGNAGSLIITSYMIYLGFSEQQMGIILSLAGLTQAFQIFSTILYAYNNNHKRTILLLKFLRIVFLLLLVLIPKWLPENFNYIIFFILIFLRFIFTHLIGGGLLQWNDYFVPEHVKGSYYSKRNIISNAVSIAVSMILGAVLDRFDGQYWIYISVIFITCFLGMIDLFILNKIDYKDSMSKSIFPIKTMIFAPLKDKRYSRYLIFSILWAFSDNLARPYLNIYTIKYMNYSYAFIAIVGSSTAFIKLFAGYGWGKLADSKSNIKIIKYTGIGFALMNGTFAAINPNALWIYALGFIMHGIFMIGFNVNNFNFNLKISKGDLRNAYLSINSAIIGISSFISIYISSHIIGWIEGRIINISEIEVNAYQILFFTSTILQIVAIYYFVKVVNDKRVSLE